MTTQQTPRDVIAQLSAFIDQQEVSRAAAQALALQWEAVANRQREELVEFQGDAWRAVEQSRAEKQELLDLLDPDADGLTLVEAVIKLRASATLAVERCKALEAQKRALLARIAQLEGTQVDDSTLGFCPRCGAALNNLSPGISVVAGGVSVCTTCLRPGETELLRARGL